MTTPFLNVSQSLSGARWISHSVSDLDVTRMMQQHGLPEIVSRLLVSRSVAPEQAISFLTPTLQDHFPNPLSMKNMEAAAETLTKAIIDRKPMQIFGDFDVDGATSSAILFRFFKMAGMTLPIHIPDRLNEGYGPNVPALAQFKAEGIELVIMADCGTGAPDVIEAGRNMGLDIIILDHHEAGETLPPATHLVNPKQPGCTSGLDMLAACGVCFLLCVAINTKLKENGYYARENITPPDLKSFLDLVAFGTVCDMVPLTGANRLFVKKGMQVLNTKNNHGIRSLCETGNVKDEITMMHLGFTLGPRINAGSRVHNSSLGAKLLSTDNEREAMDLAWALHDCNERRKLIQKDMLKAAENRISALSLNDDPILIVDLPDGHAGLAGIVAGRLKDKYQKPACVITYADTDNGREGRGSGRSIKGISMADLFQAAYEKNIIIKGGGHAMAGGFTLIPDRVDDFRNFIRDYADTMKLYIPETPDFFIDSLISVQGAQPAAIKKLENELGPFGTGHEEPVFALGNVHVYNARIVGNGHVSCQIGDREGGARVKGIAFNQAEEPLGKAILNNKGEPLHLAGNLKIDSWQGRDNASLHIKDGATTH